MTKNKKYPLVMNGTVGRLAAIAQTILVKAGKLDETAPNGKSNIDGFFGDISTEAARDFQRDVMGLTGKDVDGKIGKITWPELLKLEPIFEIEVVTEFPPKPNFKALSNSARQAIFGRFDYEPKNPTQEGQEIDILDDFEKTTIQKFWIPQLEGVPFYHPDSHQKCSGFIRLHKLAGPRFQKFFDRVELLGYKPYIETLDGSFYPRYVRGSTESLSNHSWGTAIDINGFANPLGKQPARMGEIGCILPLVEIANEFGIYWGGHFSRMDGMHFEVTLL